MLRLAFSRAFRRGDQLSSMRWTIARSFAALPDHKLIRMPALSPTMEVGTIQEWKKKEGDSIEEGEVLAEIETDKATRSYEYNDEGFVARVSNFVPEQIFYLSFPLVKRQIPNETTTSDLKICIGIR